MTPQMLIFSSALVALIIIASAEVAGWTEYAARQIRYDLEAQDAPSARHIKNEFYREQGE